MTTQNTAQRLTDAIAELNFMANDRRHKFERGEDENDRCRCGNSREWHPRDWR